MNKIKNMKIAGFDTCLSASLDTGFFRTPIFLSVIISVCFTLAVSVNSNAQSIPPAWAKGIAWYQIFPERFNNGDTANDPRAEKVFINENRNTEGWCTVSWTSDWFAQTEWEEKQAGSFRDKMGSRRYGGDIQGIINKLDYIKSLGIGAIYLNPVFDAVSMHKYDGSTFHHADVNFGPAPETDAVLMKSEVPDNPKTWQWTTADKKLLELIKTAHQKGLKVVLDGVFNHTGVQFWAFQDIVKNGKDSKYADWFQVKSFDNAATPENEFDYKGWWGHKSLPEFNRTAENLNPKVKDYIFASVKRWMDPDNDGNTSDGVDGWRLDVAKEVPIGFWQDFRKHVKSVNFDAIIIGELWEFSSEFINVNGVFDALMNYNFAYAVSDFFFNKKEMTTAEFIAVLKQIDIAYPEENLYVLQNLMTSHDTERLSSMIANPGRVYNRESDEKNPTYYAGKPKPETYEMQKLVAAFQFTYRGAPMVYYGDEVGMWGANDPHERKPMLWDELLYQDERITAASGFTAGHGKYKVKADRNLLSLYRRLGAMRNYSEALRIGTVEWILSEDNNRVVGFLRKHKNETVLVYFNLSNKSEIIEYPVPVKEVMDLNGIEKIKIDENLLRFALWGNSYAIYQIME